MSGLPTKGVFTNTATTNAQAKQAQDDMLAQLHATPGMKAEETLTMASGAVTPTGGMASIDTEAAAVADDLTTIVTTNIEDGGSIWIRGANPAHVVTVKHATDPAAGEIRLAGGADLVLNDTSIWLMLKRTGSSWEEVGRFYGNAKAAARAFLDLATAVKSDASTTLTKGYPQNSYPIGATGSATITPNVANSNKQTATIDGDPTFAAPADDCDIRVTCVNSGAGHSVSFSGFATDLLPNSKAWNAADAAINDIAICVDLGGTRKRYGIYNNA